MPPPGCRDAPRAAAGAGDRYGTTVRRFDRAAGLWRIAWINPVTGAANQLAGRRDGDRIVLVGEAEGRPIRWSFNEITRDSFRWLGEVKEGDAWRAQAEFRLRRIA